MTTQLNKVSISPKNPALPTVKITGLNRDGVLDENLDFFKDGLQGDWWTFHEYTSTPRYNDQDVTYTIAIKSTHTCTGDSATLDMIKQEYLRLGLGELFKYYNKSFNSGLIESFATDTDDNDNNISRVIDYHLRPRPSEKMKFLIEVNAEYFNAVPANNQPASFVNNLDSNGNLTIVDGLLNPVGDVAHDGISIVTLKSNTYDREIVKTASAMSHHYDEMIRAGHKIPGVNLYKEADRMLSVSALLSSLVAANYDVNGVGAGYGSDSALGPAPPDYMDDNYNIHLAFKEKDGDKEHVELLWAAVTSPSSKGSKYLHVGFERFLNTHPINSPTSLHYLYWHQQVLNNYDKNIELNYVDFLEAYHYPKIKTSDIVSSSTVSAPFESSAGSDKYDPSSYTPKDFHPKKCGVKRDGFDFQPPNLSSMLQNAFSPINFMPQVQVNLNFLTPCTPISHTGIGPPLISNQAWEALKERIFKTSDNWKRMWNDAEDSWIRVGEYYTTKEFQEDIETRGKAGALKLRQLGDLVLNQLSFEKMLQLVCICITQIADEALSEAGINPEVPSVSLSAKGPGFKFDPSMLSDDDPNFNLAEAFEGSLGSVDVGATNRPFKLQEICSMCICLPDILIHLPTFDLLINIMKMLLNLLEALIVGILLALIQQLLAWLTQCPDYQCDLDGTGPAIDDFGAQNIEDLLDQPVACFIFDELEASGVDTKALVSNLLARMSEELTTGEVSNVLQGYPTTTAVHVIKDIVEYEQEFEPLLPYLNTVALIEDFIGCLSDVASPSALDDLDTEVSDPDYCTEEDKLPITHLMAKCHYDAEINKFILREKSSAAARLKSVVQSFTDDPSYLGKFFPAIYSVKNSDGTKTPGLLADAKFKPPVVDTYIEAVVDPMVDMINKYASRGGRGFLKNLYEQDKNSGTRFFWDEDELQVFSIAQLAAATPLIIAAPPVAAALAPMSFDRDMNSKYPIVGGSSVQDMLTYLESKTGILYADKWHPTIVGAQADAISAGLPSAADREFNQRLIFYIRGLTMSVNFESVTETLLADPEGSGGFSNHVVLNIKQLQEDVSDLATSKKPPGWDSLPPDDPYKIWWKSKWDMPIFTKNESNYYFRVPTDTLDIDTELYTEVSELSPNSISYSPQSKVFGKLIQNGLKSVYDKVPNFSPTGQAVKTDLEAHFQSSVYMYAFRTMIERLGIAASESAFFRTYTYEQIEKGADGLASNGNPFDAIRRKNPYSNFGVYPFKQKYSADDFGGRTKVYFKPVPALENTSLGHRTISLVRSEELKKEIKDSWDWTEQWDPSDLNSLPPLSVAITDGLVGELINLYCIEAFLKAGAATTTFKNYSTPGNQKILSEVLTEVVVSDIEADGYDFNDQLYSYINSYMERKYLADGLSINDAPKDKQAVAAMIEEKLKPSEDGSPSLAETTAMDALNILHLNMEDESLKTPLAHIVTPNPNPFTPASNAPPKETFHVASVLQSFIDNPPPTPTYPETQTRFSNIADLKNGGFVYERFIRVELHAETKSWFESLNPGMFDRINGAVTSLEGLQDLDISLYFTNITEENNFLIEALQEADILSLSDTGVSNSEFLYAIQALYGLIKSPFEWGGMEKNHPEAWNVFKNATSIAGPTGLFKEIKHCIRMNYVIVENNLENNPWNDQFSIIFNNILSSPPPPVTTDPGWTNTLKGFYGEVAKEKSLVLREGNKNILVFPLAEHASLWDALYQNALPQLFDAGEEVMVFNPVAGSQQTISGMIEYVESPAVPGAPSKAFETKIATMQEAYAAMNMGPFGDETDTNYALEGTWTIEFLRYLMGEIIPSTPAGPKNYRAYYRFEVGGNYSEITEKWSWNKVFYEVPKTTPLGPLESDPAGTVKDVSFLTGEEMRVYEATFQMLPKEHQDALLAGYEDAGKPYSNEYSFIDYSVTPEPKPTKPIGLDCGSAFNLAPGDDVSTFFKNTPQKTWETLFSYALPESMAASLLTVITLLATLERPETRGGFRGAKNAFKQCLIAANSRSTFTGYPSESMNMSDFDEDEPPDYDYSGEVQPEGTSQDNLTLLVDLGEIDDSEWENILLEQAKQDGAWDPDWDPNDNSSDNS